jgi:hypothetical protein
MLPDTTNNALVRIWLLDSTLCTQHNHQSLVNLDTVPLKTFNNGWYTPHSLVPCHSTVSASVDLHLRKRWNGKTANSLICNCIKPTRPLPQTQWVLYAVGVNA